MSLLRGTRQGSWGEQQIRQPRYFESYGAICGVIHLLMDHPLQRHHREMMQSIKMYSRYHMRVAVLVFVLSLSVASAQGPTYPTYLVSGVRHTLADRTNQIILGTAGVSVLLLHTYDRSVQEYSQSHDLLSDNLSHLLDLYGGGAVYPLVMVGTGVSAYLQGNSWEEGFQKLKYVVTSMALTATLTEVLKRGTGRERPNDGARSFPSGHTSGSFVVAAILDELYGHKIGIPAYVVAGMVGLQRIHDNKHWLTDVIAGAALGTTIGRGYGSAYRKEAEESHVSIVQTRDMNELRLTIVISLD